MFSLKIEKLLIIFTGVHFIDNPLLVAVNGVHAFEVSWAQFELCMH